MRDGDRRKFGSILFRHINTARATHRRAFLPMSQRIRRAPSPPEANTSGTQGSLPKTCSDEYSDET